MGSCNFSALCHDRVRQAIRGLVQFPIRQCLIALLTAVRWPYRAAIFSKFRAGIDSSTSSLGNSTNRPEGVNALGPYRLLFEG